MFTLEKAKELKSDYLHIIGMEHRNKEISSLVVMPRNDPEFSKAMVAFTRTLNSDVAYLSSSSDGYSVFAMIEENDWTGAIRFYSEIGGTLKGLKIDWDVEDYM
jgi:hypothetical protein